MNKRLSVFLMILLLVLGGGTLAQATYYHFEDYGETNVSLTTGTTYQWSFDLEVDNLSLWVIDYNPLTNQGDDWTDAPVTEEGHMATDDVLHRAYLTMKFCSATGDVIDMFLDDVLFWDEKSIRTGGTGTISVLSQLYEDHLLTITITSLDGDFSVDWMNLAGCYGTATPVPEPGTLLLLGIGLIALAFVLAKRA